MNAVVLRSPGSAGVERIASKHGVHGLVCLSVDDFVSYSRLLIEVRNGIEQVLHSTCSHQA